MQGTKTWADTLKGYTFHTSFIGCRVSAEWISITLSI